MKLSVIIVNYNVKHYVEQCLLSVRKALRGLEAEVFVVDNHSHDGSAEYIARRFPEVRVVGSNHNLGFARANNMAIRQSRGEYVLLLNPDTIVGERTLAEVLEFMDAHPDAGSLGVRMLDARGRKAKESRRGLPSPMVSFYKMTGLCSRFPDHRRLGHYYMGGLSWDEPGRIEVVSGAFDLLRRSALDRVGVLDEDFFMYGEDIDLSYRILKGGYHNYYYPASILHYKGESTHKSSFRYVHVFYEAMLIFFRKHYSGMSLLLSLPIKAAIYTKAMVALAAMLVERTRKSLGFFVPGKQWRVRYVFIGTDRMLDRCREIARRKGLDAVFVRGDAESKPKGHLDQEVSAMIGQYRGNLQHVVYDTSAYRYEQMLDIFMEAPCPDIALGTYDNNTQLIITDNEIIR